MSSIIVQKYGGATLADPQKIKQVAARLARLSKSGARVIVVVSAMGKSTNQLIELAQQVSQNPNRRELDMLLSTGERVSMSLLSIALNDLNCQAISFTGSQAGILTNNSHLNAYIADVKSPRIEKALSEGKIVVLAGFQGVSPESKEITTLGRGGSDITAMAIASAMKASRCEILKDVDAVFTADPKTVTAAKPIHHLTYEQLMEMTFWGAKVLHYRSVELAFRNQLPLYIGPAATLDEGTINSKEGTLVDTKLNLKSKNLIGETMFESNKVLGINSHELVLQLECEHESLGTALAELEEKLEKFEIAAPQVLNTLMSGNKIQLFVTGPLEVLQAIQREFRSSPTKTDEAKTIEAKKKKITLFEKELSAVAVTCTGSFNTEMPKRISTILEKNKISITSMLMSPMSLVMLIERSQKNLAIKVLHELIEK